MPDNSNGFWASGKYSTHWVQGAAILKYSGLDLVDVRFTPSRSGGRPVPELIFADPEQEAQSLLHQFREGLAVSDSLKLIKDYQDIGVEIRKRSDEWERR